MKRVLMAAAALLALPVAAQAQNLQYPGLYLGAEGGVNWMLQSNWGNGQQFNVNANPQTGFVVGGVIGYDFVGPRVEIEGAYRGNNGTLSLNQNNNISASYNVNQIAVMANVYYDFMAGSVIVPYIGAGAGIAFENAYAFGLSSNSTQFAYQGIIGVGWNVSDQFRLNLDGRYFGTTNPTIGAGSFSNNNFSIMVGAQIKFGAPTAMAAPPPAPPPVTNSYMVFFDWDRSNLSDQALATIGQAANSFKTKGSARITATGHTDTSGPEAYNMALSLRRANTVKDALVRNGVPATAIAVIGRGEQGLLVQTADGVREPQNRRVEIVIQ